MKIFSLLFLLFFSFHFLKAQIEPELFIHLSKNIEIFKMDILDQIYTLTADKYFSKWDKKGNLLFQFINNREGNISSVDIRNPLKILIFYGDQQRIILLDRTLSPLKEWQLNQEDWGNVSCVATGKNDQIWLFDSFNYQLGAVDNKGHLARQKIDLINCCPSPPEIGIMAFTENHLFLIDKKQGVIQCDLLGQFLQFIPINEIQKVLTYTNSFWILQTNKIIEIGNNSQVKDNFRFENTTSVIGFTNKEIYLNDGKSSKVIIENSRSY